jgi:hypothetical protein
LVSSGHYLLGLGGQSAGFGDKPLSLGVPRESYGRGGQQQKEQRKTR